MLEARSFDGMDDWKKSKGVKSRLLDMIENLDESDPLLPVRSLKILADQERNVLILQGSRKQLRLLKKLIELRDQSVP